MRKDCLTIETEKNNQTMSLTDSTNNHDQGICITNVNEKIDTDETDHKIMACTIDNAEAREKGLERQTATSKIPNTVDVETIAQNKSKVSQTIHEMEGLTIRPKDPMAEVVTDRSQQQNLYEECARYRNESSYTSLNDVMVTAGLKEMYCAVSCNEHDPWAVEPTESRNSMVSLVNDGNYGQSDTTGQSAKYDIFSSLPELKRHQRATITRRKKPRKPLNGGMLFSQNSEHVINQKLGYCSISRSTDYAHANNEINKEEEAPSIAVQKGKHRPKRKLLKKLQNISKTPQARNKSKLHSSGVTTGKEKKSASISGKSGKCNLEDTCQTNEPEQSGNKDVRGIETDRQCDGCTNALPNYSETQRCPFRIDISQIHGVPSANKPDSCSYEAAMFDQYGGTLKLRDVQLYIPPGAIPEGTERQVYICVTNEDAHQSRVKRNTVAIAPTVFCGPSQKFNDNVFLTVPHCVGEQRKFVPVITQTDLNEKTDYLQAEDNVLRVSDDSIIFMVDHFTGFGAEGEPDAIYVLFVPFLERRGPDMILRLYGIRPYSLEECEKKENKLGGKQADIERKLQLFREKTENVEVRVMNLSHDWSLGDDDGVEQVSYFIHLLEYRMTTLLSHLL
ncbi:uncharacterized protein LOC102805577 [Saccoglossus kowalevskii]